MRIVYKDGLLLFSNPFGLLGKVNRTLGGSTLIESISSHEVDDMFVCFFLFSQSQLSKMMLSSDCSPSLTLRNNILHSPCINTNHEPHPY